jgi:hypothetical protein
MSKEKTLQEVLASFPTVPKGFIGTVERLESAGGSRYSVMPIRGKNNKGELDAAATLWLHSSVSWSWDFFSYSSDSWAVVTDAQTGGNVIPVDTIQAYLRHDQCYGDQVDTQHNTGVAHALVRVGCVGVCKAGVCGHGCAEKAGYGRWCTQEACA